MKLQNWVRTAEITASVAVVVTLAFVAQEVRRNTLALERQAALERASAIASPFLGESGLPGVLAKIKAIDGLDPVPQAFVDQYGLSPEEAIIWERHLWLIWAGLEADFALTGGTPEITGLIGVLLSNPDNQTYYANVERQASEEFKDFVRRIREDL